MTFRVLTYRPDRYHILWTSAPGPHRLLCYFLPHIGDIEWDYFPCRHLHSPVPTCWLYFHQSLWVLTGFVTMASLSAVIPRKWLFVIVNIERRRRVGMVGTRQRSQAAIFTALELSCFRVVLSTRRVIWIPRRHKSLDFETNKQARSGLLRDLRLQRLQPLPQSVPHFVLCCLLPRLTLLVIKSERKLDALQSV